jgi:hypothetical protein
MHGEVYDINGSIRSKAVLIALGEPFLASGVQLNVGLVF